MSDILNKLQNHWSSFLHRGVDLDAHRKNKLDEFKKFIDNEIPDKSLKKMITVNVGGGPIPTRFRSMKEILVDPLLPYFQKIYPEKYLSGMTLLAEYIGNTSIKNNYAHLVYCKKTIEYIEEWKTSLKEMHRILKRYGYLILIYHAHQSDNTNLNILGDVDMKKHFESIGFNIIKFEKGEDSYTKILARKII